MTGGIVACSRCDGTGNVETRAGYKVLRRLFPYQSEDVWGSAVMNVSNERRLGGVEYRENEWTEPDTQNGPLCVFQYPKQARDFIANTFENPARSLMRIARCEYELSGETSVWVTGRYDGIAVADKKEMPRGTILAKRVKVLEFIQ